MTGINIQFSTKTDSYTISKDRKWPEKIKALAMANFRKYDSCTQSILWAFMKEMEMENHMVLRTSGAMQGGMMTSLTCGVHTAGLMILGLMMGREKLESGLDGILPIIMPAQRLVKEVTKRIGGHSCLEMTGVDFTDLKAAMTFRQSDSHDKCITRVGDGAETIAELLQKLDADEDLFRSP
jgi:hypothetical protein